MDGASGNSKLSRDEKKAKLFPSENDEFRFLLFVSMQIFQAIWFPPNNNFFGTKLSAAEWKVVEKQCAVENNFMFTKNVKPFVSLFQQNEKRHFLFLSNMTVLMI